MPVVDLIVNNWKGALARINRLNPVPVALVSGDGDTGTPALVTTGDPFTIAIQPVITAGAYAAGDALGLRLDFVAAVLSAGGGGTITKVVIIDRDGEDSPIDVVFFNQPFTATADNAPFDPSDGDLDNCIGYIPIAATDYADFNDNSVASKASGLSMPFDYRLAPGVSILPGQMVIREGNTYTATSDIIIKITVQRR